MDAFLQTLPGWAQRLARSVRAKQANTYLLHGQPAELVPVRPAPSAAPGSRLEFLRLEEFLPSHLFAGWPSVVTYNGLLAPGNTPQTIVDALSKELIAAEKSLEFRSRLAKIGVEPVPNTPSQFAKLIADDTELWRDIVKDLDIKRN